MPTEILPCYNSEVIELFLDRIPDLSKIFLYANDDMFFGNYVSKDFFVKNNKPLIRMVKTPILQNCWYERTIPKAQTIIAREYGVKYNLMPTHNIDVYSKEAITECKKIFQKDIEKVINHHLRADGDIERVLFHYYMIKNMCVLETYDGKESRYIRFAKRFLFPSMYLDYVYYRMEQIKWAKLLFYRKPKLVCISDSEYTTENDLQEYQRLMKKKFPSKSQFEL